jgi:hypothetical protein
VESRRQGRRPRLRRRHAGRRSGDQHSGLKLIAQSEGASPQDCVRLTVYVSDLYRYAPTVDKAQVDLWGKPPYPPRTMVED